MILVKLMGGLGNQMFQYACALAQAKRLEVDLLVDINFLKKNIVGVTKREYQLNQFKVSAGIAKTKELLLADAVDFSFFQKLIRKINPLPPELKLQNYHESSIVYDNRIQTIKNDTYLIGYFPSEKYFKDIRIELLQEFTLKKAFNSANQQVLKKINSTNAVALHIRRGDYVSDAKTNQFHGVCSLDYYQRAIKIMQKKNTNLTFFVFSDDADWVKQNLKAEGSFYFVNCNSPKQGFFDMMIMKQCKHFIIANSSFSWWAAWLSENPNKQIIAPEKWFSGAQEDKYSTKDLIPMTWQQI